MGNKNPGDFIILPTQLEDLPGLVLGLSGHYIIDSDVKVPSRCHSEVIEMGLQVILLKEAQTDVLVPHTGHRQGFDFNLDKFGMMQLFINRSDLGSVQI